ncbi:MAG TPA: Uma2 family endonuclease [Tepidisphaeraceae bacterium]|nr:Uma2 family endonuclease [Tepidisphaeraceae bacterium]
MTIATPESSPGLADRFATQRFTMHDVPWAAYESIVAALGDRRRVFVTYNRGTMSPSPEHERIGWVLARLIQSYTEVKRIPLLSLGMATWRRPAERGLEADQCFYIRNAPRMRSRVRTRTPIDLAIDPPPDLAIEVDLSRSSADKEDTYAGLGVPELWRYEYDGRVTVLRLAGERYVVAPASATFPDLPMADVTAWVEPGLDMDETEFALAFRQWAEGRAG